MKDITLKEELLAIVSLYLGDVAEKPDRLNRAYELAEQNIIEALRKRKLLDE